MPEKKYRYTIERRALYWNNQYLTVDADSEEEALEQFKNDPTAKVIDYVDLFQVSLNPVKLHHACEYCGKQPDVQPWASGYVVRCYDNNCPRHPLFYRKTETEAFRAWDEYWSAYDKMCNNE